MKIKHIAVYTIILLGVLCSSCGNLMSLKDSLVKQERPGQYEDFTQRMAKADQVLNVKDFENARRLFVEAQAIAEQNGWANETVSAKVAVAEVDMFTGRFEVSENGLKDAISFCERENECSSEQMDVGVSYLNFLYLHQMKNVRKSIDLIKQLKTLKVCATGKCEKYICKYVSDLRDAGYSKESSPLAIEEQCK